jgi:hypothetical protein
MNTGHMISDFIASNFYYVFLGVLVINLFQRKHQKKSPRKRFATLFIAIGVFVFYTAAQLIRNFDANDAILFPVLAAILFVFYRFRAKLFPFSLKCKQCAKKLDYNQVLFNDSNLCSDCEPPDEESIDTDPKIEVEEEDKDHSDSTE